MTITVEIPALDRLCAILENRDKSVMAQEIEDEIVAKLEAAAKGGTPRPEFKEVKNDPDNPWKGEAKAAKETTSSVTADAVPPSPEVEGSGGHTTLADVQQACARLRDAGKMAEVKGLFPEFGIKKLSDLKSADQLAAFAERLKKLEG